MPVLDTLSALPSGVVGLALMLWLAPAWVHRVLAALRDFDSYRDERTSRKRR